MTIDRCLIARRLLDFAKDDDAPPGGNLCKDVQRGLGGFQVTLEIVP